MTLLATAASATGRHRRRESRWLTSGVQSPSATSTAAVERPSRGIDTRSALAAATGTASVRSGAERRRASAAVGRICQRHRAAGPRRQVEGKQPLVVLGLTAVDAQRILFALTAHPHHAPHHRSIRRGLNRLQAAGTRLRRDHGANAHDLELAILGHWILVLLAKVAAFDERVDAGWKGVRDVRVLEPVEGDRARVLLSAPDQFGFLFTTGFLAPHRHRDRHQDAHDGERHEQCGHRVSELVCEHPPAPVLTT